ncbi:MAG: NAD(P)/FAD-dependent oxidoreductase [Acidimicrobiales bacterium]
MSAPEPTHTPSSGDGTTPNVVIIGAGPAGLTAAYQLTKYGITSTIIESDDVVGGISRTVERDGWRFDIGGHRFFTKVGVVNELWHEILSDEDFMLRPRMSRIYYQGKYYDYPLKAMNALKNLGVIEALRCVLSYLWVRIRPPKDLTTFEGWTASRFGWRLYRHFFETYTEKVWGVPPSKLQADWAAQRIKNLSLFSAVMNALLPKRNQKDITSLIEEFEYPKYGPGMMWERCRDIVTDRGCQVLMETKVVGIRHEGGKAVAVISERDGVRTEHPCDHVISSMPFSALLESMEPAPPESVIMAAKDLGYRDFLTVALVVPEEAGFPDNWIYVHSPDVQVGRIQNFGSWSPYLVKEGRTCLGLEYFVFEGDELWSSPDEELIELGTRARRARPRRTRPGGGRVRRADAEGVPVLRRALQGQRGPHARLDRGRHAERPPGRAQRHAQVQQPGPLDVHGPVERREHRRRPAPRRVGRQRRGGVPRGDLGPIDRRRVGRHGHRP